MEPAPNSFATASAPHLVHILHHVLARGLEVGNEGHAVRNALEVVQGEVQAAGARHGNQVQHCMQWAGSYSGHAAEDGVVTMAAKQTEWMPLGSRTRRSNTTHRRWWSRRWPSQ